ncbi:MAG: hybrid sensor histidine kinase/response regulator, partial [Gammaproteobacteria bacterium]|nr:hybrid sensor histidine kinase/response regulator [Gammaproteobacteria bacterium]
TALTDGILWGLAGLFFLLPDSAPHQMILLTMIVGIPAGSIFATSYWPRTNFFFALPAISLAALGLVLQGSPASVGMAIGMLVYLVILYRMMQQAHAAAMHAIRLKYENLELVGQLREQRDAAEQANVAKSRFLAAASHDLRQPLHALGLFVTALRERNRHAELREIVAHIERCVTALGSLFEALLDVSRLDAGVVEPRPVHFALRTVLDRLAPEYEPQARAQGLDFSVAGGDILAHSDPALVERILRNLLSNALRYTPRGAVQVTARDVGAQVEIAVRDTGPGIPPDKREEVFMEFVQLANPERDRTKGLGLGLAIVRRLATLLDGTVVLDAAEGGGSEFRVRLPRGDAAAIVATVEPLALATIPFAGWLVVVIDDERAVREAMQVLLEGWGCVALTAESAVDAVQRLHAAGRRPDVIIADYRLRENATGAEAIGLLQREFGAAIPGFIITGDTAPERLQEASASGHLLLHKPVQPGKLRALLANLQRAVARDTASR